jgi:hypothetical protein
LAVLDWDDDGDDDLAIGVPGEDSGAGAVHVLWGVSGGLSASGSEFFNQSLAGGSPEGNDYFGASLARVTGCIANDGLAVGAIGENSNAGAVSVYMPAFDAGATVTQGASWIPAMSEAGDFFGSSLASGNFHGQDSRDLVVGIPHEDLSGFKEGAIAVLRVPEFNLCPWEI